jgi:short-subunit dehydrogenase
MTTLLDGSTVLITGASAGIGRALAEQVASRAGELLLVARRVDRLTALAEQIRSRPGAPRVHSVGCDVGNDDDIDALLGRLGVDLPAPDVLIANAGVGDADLFDAADWTRLERIISVNVTATTRLLHGVLPHMVDRGRGGLLVIGSGAGLSLMAGSATYTASKHYLHGLTQTLRAELAGTGVTVTEVCPGPVATEFDIAAGIPPAESGPGRWLRISAERCASDALAGFDRGRALVFPGRTYRMLMRLQAMTPLALQRGAAARTARQLRRTLPPPVPGPKGAGTASVP